MIAEKAADDGRQDHSRNLVGLSLQELEEFLKPLGKEKYRAHQISDWIYHKRCTSFAHMTNLSKTFRGKLAEVASLGLPEVVEERQSRLDRTRKLLLRLDDGAAVETVIIPDGRRVTQCVSSQVGCAWKCVFCATGTEGLVRDLSAGEIVGQVLVAQQMMAERHPITNVVFMGMGEPFSNYEEVIRACNILSAEWGMGISARKITLSTSGVTPAIKRYREEGHRYRLALSLNAPTDPLRRKLMPIGHRYPLDELLAEISRYARTARRRVTLEYVLIRGANDSLREAKALAAALEGIPCKINLISYNPLPGLPFAPTTGERMERFRDYLYTRCPVVSIRKSKGQDIEAACGQLRGRVERPS